MTVSSVSKWSEIVDAKDAERFWLTTSLDGIYDLAWSFDSCSVIAGAINNRVSFLLACSCKNCSLVIMKLLLNLL